GVWCESISGCISEISTITINVKEVVPTIKVIASTQTTISPGISVNFTTTITNGGSNPIYQWLKNGTPVGVNSPTYLDNSLTDKDKVSCVLTSNETCRQLTNVVSNVLEFSMPTLTTNGGCAGSILSLSEHPYSEITWKRNGVPIDNKIPWDSVYYSNNLSSSDRVVVAGTKSKFTPGSVFRDRAGNIYINYTQVFKKWLPEEATEAEIILYSDFIDAEGNSYVIDKGSHQVLKYLPGSTIGLVVAGGYGAGNASNQLNT
ncbi:hypothetical protein, partial [Aphanothece microscopica]|uniref:hypothetical protein n=1 Tax=Aphanothece microscopica TaxID=1049561 RepID=UPI0039853326